MKKLINRLGPTWTATLAICVTLIVASGATATAAKLINGKNIKKGTIAGTKLKKNTLTGTQIKESKLGTVPKATNADNASTVGGAGLGNLVQGGGHSYSGSKDGGSSSNNNVVLEVPGIGRVEFDCAGNGVDATPRFVNSSGGSLYVMGMTIARDGTPINTDEANMAPNVPGLADGGSTNLQSASQSSSRSGGTSTFQVWSTSRDKRATFTVSSIFCSYTASAVTNQ